jgi:DNA-binding transcriptional MerR regulator
MDTLQVESELGLTFRNPMKNIYLLKDLSRISGLTTHTLKFYLRIGLLKEFGRSPETNFRYFDDASLRTIKRIKALQERDKTLSEIKDMFNRK